MGVGWGGMSLSLRLPFPLLFNVVHNRTHFTGLLQEVKEIMGFPS